MDVNATLQSKSGVSVLREEFYTITPGLDGTRCEAEREERFIKYCRTLEL